VLFLVEDDVIVVGAGGSPVCVEGAAGIGVNAANMLVAASVEARIRCEAVPEGARHAGVHKRTRRCDSRLCRAAGWSARRSARCSAERSARGSARRCSALDAEAGGHVAVVLAVRGEVVAVEPVAACVIAADVAALRVGVEEAAPGEVPRGAGPADALRLTVS
jgi:hypothetical protein